MADNKHSQESLWIRSLLASVVLAASVAGASLSAPAYAAVFTVYKSPWCGCCSKWVDHLKANGHFVTTENVEDLDLIKQMVGVPEALESCHTALVDGYIVEGHVPAIDIERLLAERPEAKGLAVAGMPSGSPGMESDTADRYNVMLFKADGSANIYAQY